MDSLDDRGVGMHSANATSIISEGARQLLTSVTPVVIARAASWEFHSAALMGVTTGD